VRNFLNDVIPVVVTYNAEIKGLAALLNSLRLFDKVQLVDNGSNNVAQLKEFCSKYQNIRTSFLLSNVGLAEAQNLAVDSITTNDACTFIILFDQDSVPVGNCIEALHNHAIKLIDKSAHLGVIGPELVDSFSDSRFGFIRKGKRFYKEDTTTSVF
jgi:GT2 family glycosyltransferase